MNGMVCASTILSMEKEPVTRAMPTMDSTTGIS